MKQRIEYLVDILNKASEAYYNDQDEVMPNYEWDKLYDELVELEYQTNYILPNSPTQKTGSVETFEGAREPHEFPALSLAKSKDITVLQKWAGNRPIWLSWKLDGITLVATYDNGSLTRLLTRGNGHEGTNITFLANYISGLPMTIDYSGHMVVRGEAVISYEDFDRLNTSDEQYANPRNLVSGTLAVDPDKAEVVRERKVTFNAFTLVYLDNYILSWGERMDYLEKLGFSVVDRELTSSSNLPSTVEKWTEEVKRGANKWPVDGLVICYDDTEYAATGSITGHHATNAGMAFKWPDTAAETELEYIEWSCASSTITPIAVFKPVQLEGTIVQRASLCNISELKRLGIGANHKTTVKVIKANMIIPKVIEADAHGTTFSIPKFCPVCNFKTQIRVSDKTKVETLHCTNPDCVAKHLKRFTRFVSKPGMDIDGLSEKTLMRFINEGMIEDFADIYNLKNYMPEILYIDGFGLTSFTNLISSIDKSRKVHPVNFIFALSIPMVGMDAAKRLVKAFGDDAVNQIRNRGSFEDIEGIGPERSNSIVEWSGDERNQKLLDKLLANVELEYVVMNEGKKCEGLIFAITGEITCFHNRDELVEYIESQGGKVSNSVSSKTTYLINNDISSSSSKNTKAKELGIPVINEGTFVEKFIWEGKLCQQ